ncbi:MAG: ferredoxin--NADP reductase [Armatimonadota bacterium]
MAKLTLPLSERRDVAKGTMSFAFGLEGQPFLFKPGQYVSCTIPNPLYQDDEGNTRTFSIASSPRDPVLLIATRMRGSAFKRTLAEVPLGTNVNFNGPSGSFTLFQDASRPAVLVAGGIGITPFRSIVKDAAEQQLPHRLTLIYSNRTPEDAPFLNELYGWAQENPNFRFVPTMTQPEDSKQEWKGRTGYIDVAFLRDTLDGADRLIVYVAGPPGMVGGVKKALLEAGIPEDSIRAEEFDGY